MLGVRARAPVRRCLFVTYLHLDLHAAVGELLNHAVNPDERLHLSHRGRERTGSEGRAQSWTASQSPTSAGRRSGEQTRFVCSAGGKTKISLDGSELVELRLNTSVLED